MPLPSSIWNQATENSEPPRDWGRTNKQSACLPNVCDVSGTQALELLFCYLRQHFHLLILGCKDPSKRLNLNFKFPPPPPSPQHCLQQCCWLIFSQAFLHCFIIFWSSLILFIHLRVFMLAVRSFIIYLHISSILLIFPLF